MMATATILVSRGVDIEVEVVGFFEGGEPMTLEGPEVRGSVEFDSAWVNNKPFELTDEEKAKAEEAMLDSIREQLPRWQRKRYCI
jgi:hypothetical protein